MKRKQFLQALFLSTASLAVTSRSSLTRAKENSKVILGQIDLSFYQVKGALVRAVLEEMGYTVEVKERLHEEMFPLLNSGEIDLLVAAWLPEAHASYWSEVKDSSTVLTTLYDNAYFFWAVPDYVPESAVREIGDLAKPEVAAKMNKTIQGIGQGASITTFSQNAVKEYGLSQRLLRRATTEPALTVGELGYQLLTGEAEEWVVAFEEAVSREEWAILPVWQPQYLNQAYSLRELQDPLRVLGSNNRGVIVATNSFIEKFPASDLEKLQNISLDIDAVNEMDYMVNVEEKTPQEAAQIWISANRDRYKSWLN